MRRGARVAFALVAALAGGEAAPAEPAATPAEARGADAGAPDARPNLLLLTLDTVRADHLGLYGYERDTSPALDAFGESAVVFDAAQAGPFPPSPRP